jgi:general secretion pathway protein H
MDHFTGGIPRQQRTWPETINVEFTTAEQLQYSGKRGEIRFFPEGGSTGGRLMLSSSGKILKLEVDWLDGRIRYE